MLLSLQDPKNIEDGYLWSDIPIQKIMDLIVPFHCPSDESKSVRGYIQLGAEEELSKWDIFLSVDGRSTEYTVANKFKIRKQRRTIQTSPVKSTNEFASKFLGSTMLLLIFVNILYSSDTLMS